jgi:hypothetical protein
MLVICNQNIVLMKLLKYILLPIAFLSLIFWIIMHFDEKTKKCNSVSPSFLSSKGEVHDKYLVKPDGRIIFSVNDSNHYSLKIYAGGEPGQLMPFIENVFNPVFISGNITAMQDYNGDENYKTTSNELDNYIGSKFIKKIYSFNCGDLIILQLANDANVYLINLRTKTKIKLFSVTQKLNGVIFSEKENYLIVSFDHRLVSVNVSSGAINDLADCLGGEKLNPYLFNNFIYFVNNSLSEYYQVYMIDLNMLTEHMIQPVLQLEHDIRMPKVKGNYMYFIEVINSEYILKKINLITKKIDEITFQGVVYNFDFYGEGQISLIYSDLVTPKALMIYNESDRSFFNISGCRVDHDLSFQYITSVSGNSSAYLLNRTNNEVKGLILFFHPGLHSDFSPRWDPVLMNLCNNGYIIIAPNFPMSSGYGKKFFNSGFLKALEDAKKWKSYILKNYPNIPLFYLSASSGNVLMENLIITDPTRIEAVASLFGVPVKTSWKSLPVPALYILGENDPIVDFDNRFHELKKENGLHLSAAIVSYPDEGHWFRKRDNLNDAIDKILFHFCQFAK